MGKALAGGRRANVVLAVKFGPPFDEDPSHPAATSVIIGPRTMEHLDAYLAVDGIDLSSDMLDRIDQIVPPGVTINIADNMWDYGTPALSAAFHRRLSLS